MADSRFMWDNLIDLATITQSSEDATLIGDNVANALRTKVWLTGTSNSAEWIVFDLGSTQYQPTCVILLDHDLTESDSGIALEGHTSDSWGSPTITENLTRVAGPIAAYFSNQFSLRYWRIRFTKSASGETRQIGRVFLGTYDEVPVSDAPIRQIDTSKGKRADGGQTFHDIQEIYKQIMMKMNLITKAERDALETMFASVGIHTPYFVSVEHDVEPVDWLFYVKTKVLPGLMPKISTTDYAATFTLNEEL